MSKIRVSRLKFVAMIATLSFASPVSAELLMHFDPQVIDSMFQNGNTTGGTVPVTGVGEPVRWISDQVNGWDMQQAGAAPALASGPGPQSATVLNFAGGQNLLLLDGDLGNFGNISSPTDQLDVASLTFVLAAKISSEGTGVGHVFDFKYNGTGGALNSFIGLRYDYTFGELVGYAAGSEIFATFPTDTWFVAEMVWDGGNSLSLSIDGGAAISTVVGPVPEGFAFERGRFGQVGHAGGGTLRGDMGDVYVFNSASEDNAALVAQLMSDYTEAPLTVPGDFNGDGNVDGADFVVWQTNFPNNSGTATLDTGDANGDGNVDGADFVIWQTNFPFISDSSITAVPEPSACMLVFVGAALSLVYWRRARCADCRHAYLPSTERAH